MPKPTIRSSYVLDSETGRLLDEIARRWNTSKSAALRQAIRMAAGRIPEPDDPLKALDELQKRLELRPAKAAAWARTVRAERRASFPRKAPGKP